LQRNEEYRPETDPLASDATIIHIYSEMA
jgi:hypothetical protein